jgi:hypothetical protein
MQARAAFLAALLAAAAPAAIGVAAAVETDPQLQHWLRVCDAPQLDYWIQLCAKVQSRDPSMDRDSSGPREPDARTRDGTQVPPAQPPASTPTPNLAEEKV